MRVEACPSQKGIASVDRRAGRDAAISMVRNCGSNIAPEHTWRASEIEVDHLAHHEDAHGHPDRGAASIMLPSGSSRTATCSGLVM